MKKNVKTTTRNTQNVPAYLDQLNGEPIDFDRVLTWLKMDGHNLCRNASFMIIRNGMTDAPAIRLYPAGYKQNIQLDQNETCIRLIEFAKGHMIPVVHTDGEVNPKYLGEIALAIKPKYIGGVATYKFFGHDNKTFKFWVIGRNKPYTLNQINGVATTDVRYTRDHKGTRLVALDTVGTVHITRVTQALKDFGANDMAWNKLPMQNVLTIKTVPQTRAVPLLFTTPQGFFRYGDAIKPVIDDQPEIKEVNVQTTGPNVVLRTQEQYFGFRFGAKRPTLTPIEVDPQVIGRNDPMIIGMQGINVFDPRNHTLQTLTTKF